MLLEIMLEDARCAGEWTVVVHAVCKKLSKGQSVETIAEAVEMDVEKVKQIIQVIECYAPEYDIDEISDELVRKRIELD